MRRPPPDLESAARRRLGGPPGRSPGTWRRCRCTERRDASASARATVDLPAPDGPSIATMSGAGVRRARPCAWRISTGGSRRRRAVRAAGVAGARRRSAATSRGVSARCGSRGKIGVANRTDRRRASASRRDGRSWRTCDGSAAISPASASREASVLPSPPRTTASARPTRSRTDASARPRARCPSAASRGRASLGRAGDLHEVLLGAAGRRMRHQAREVPVVRQEQQSLRLHVEASDRLDPRRRRPGIRCSTVSRPSGSETVVTNPLGLFSRM